MTTTDNAELCDGLNTQSPVKRLIALGWYDGPTDGILQIGTDGPSYRFSTLEVIHRDDDNDLRIYGLYPLSTGALDKVVALIEPHLSPRWPVWWPIWNFATEDVRNTISQEIQRIESQAGPLAWIVAGDLANGPIRALAIQAA